MKRKDRIQKPVFLVFFVRHQEWQFLVRYRWNPLTFRDLAAFLAFSQSLLILPFFMLFYSRRGARLNAIAPGIIVTPLALDELNGPRGDFYKNMFAKCPAGRSGTADEVANVAELLMSEKGTFISGSTFLIDGGATASYFYGPLKP